MEIEIAKTHYVKVPIAEAMAWGGMVWDWEVVSGREAWRWHLAEEDDVFLEITQEILGWNGDAEWYTRFYLEASELALTDRFRHDKALVREYILANIDRIIPYDDVSDYEDDFGEPK